MEPGLGFSLLGLAPATGFEPVTFRLTAERSTAELRRNTGNEINQGFSHRAGSRNEFANSGCSFPLRNAEKISTIFYLFNTLM